MYKIQKMTKEDWSWFNRLPEQNQKNVIAEKINEIIDNFPENKKRRR